MKAATSVIGQHSRQKEGAFGSGDHEDKACISARLNKHCFTRFHVTNSSELPEHSFLSYIKQKHKASLLKPLHPLTWFPQHQIKDIFLTVKAPFLCTDTRSVVGVEEAISIVVHALERHHVSFYCHDLIRLPRPSQRDQGRQTHTGDASEQVQIPVLIMFPSLQEYRQI